MRSPETINHKPKETVGDKKKEEPGKVNIAEIVETLKDPNTVKCLDRVVEAIRGSKGQDRTEWDTFCEKQDLGTPSAVAMAIISFLGPLKKVQASKGVFSKLGAGAQLLALAGGKDVQKILRKWPEIKLFLVEKDIIDAKGNVIEEETARRSAGRAGR